LLGASEQTAPATAGQVAGLALLGIGLFMIILGIFLMLGPSTYSSTARIKIERDASTGSGPNGAPSYSYDPYFIQTEFEVIQSEVVLDKVIKGLNLNEEWGKKHSSGQPLKTPETIGLLRKRLEFRPIRNTSLIEIRVLSEKPEEAPRLANAIAEAYQEFRQAQRKRMGMSGIAAMEDRWKEQEGKVREAQAKVDHLREELKIPDPMVNSDGPPTLVSAETLRRIEGLRIESKAELVRQETLLKALKELSGEDLIQALPTAAQDNLLGSLLEQLTLIEQRLVGLKKDFGPANTEVTKAEAQAADLHEKIKTRVNGILVGLEAKVASLKEGLKNLEKEATEAATVDVDKARQSQPYFEAKRNMEDLQRFRQILTMKIEQEKIEQSLPKTMLVEITDAATVASRPVSPNRPAAGALIVLGVLLDLIGLRMLKGKPSARLMAQPA
jgi:uncharacterized protein involved in exopolysaccharide biosynthesis